MADPFFKADAVTALAAGQWIIANKADWQTKQQTLGLCITTVANFGVQVILKDAAPVTPIGEQIPPGNLGELHDTLKVIQKEINAPTASGVGFILPVLPLLIEAAIEILKAWLGRKS